MNSQTLHIELLIDKKEAPFDLLKLADPSVTQIDQYLVSGACYIATIDSEVIGVMVLDEIDLITLEVKNIAVRESVQGNGFGKMLLRFADKVGRESKYQKLVIGTGNSSINQLSLYQKEGFEISGIDQDFFVRNYKQRIFENGIQCKHMIILEKNLL